MVYVTVAKGSDPAQLRVRLADALGEGFSVQTRDEPAGDSTSIRCCSP